MSLEEEIQVASLGADQLSLGTILPPRDLMVVLMLSWISRQLRAGSGSSSESLASE